MRQYKIVEMEDGHGNPKFQVRVKQLWGWFAYWCDWGETYGTMQEATDKVKYFIDQEKDDQRIKVKEYVYTAVPNHVPQEQVGKFMEVKNKS